MRSPSSRLPVRSEVVISFYEPWSIWVACNQPRIITDWQCWWRLHWFPSGLEICDELWFWVALNDSKWILHFGNLRTCCSQTKLTQSTPKFYSSPGCTQWDRSNFHPLLLMIHARWYFISWGCHPSRGDTPNSGPVFRVAHSLEGEFPWCRRHPASTSPRW
jgi:hypothetical protein